MRANCEASSQTGNISKSHNVAGFLINHEKQLGNKSKYKALKLSEAVMDEN